MKKNNEIVFDTKKYKIGKLTEEEKIARIRLAAKKLGIKIGDK